MGPHDDEQMRAIAPRHGDASDDETGETPNPEQDERVSQCLLDIARRLPRYAQLATRLIAEGQMSARQRAPLVGLFGQGRVPMSLIPRFIPLLDRIDDLVVMFRAIDYALENMSPEAANEHLVAAGLTRAEVEADLATATRIARQVADFGAQNAAIVVQSAAVAAQTGARVAGRLAGKGMQALRKHRSRSGPPSSSPPSPPELPKP